MTMTVTTVRSGHLIGEKFTGRAFVVDFVADGSGDAGTVAIDFSGKLTDIVTTETCDVGIVDYDGVDLLGGSGDALLGRVASSPSPNVIDGVTVTVGGAAASATGKVIIYVN